MDLNNIEDGRDCRTQQLSVGMVVCRQDRLYGCTSNPILTSVKATVFVVSFVFFALAYCHPYTEFMGMYVRTFLITSRISG